MREAMHTYLKLNAEVLELLHQAAARSGCKFTLDLARPDSARFPDFRAARLLTMETMEYAEVGKVEEAIRSAEAAFRLASMFGNEPLFCSSLAAMTCPWIPTEQLERLVHRHRLQDRELNRLQSAFRGALDRNLLIRGLLERQCSHIRFFREQVIAPGGLTRLAVQSSADRTRVWLQGMADRIREEKRPPWEHLALLPPAWFKGEMAAHLALTGRLLAIARLPYPECLRVGASEADALKSGMPEVFTVSRYLLSFDSYGAAFLSMQGVMARLDTARTAMAVLRFQAARGTLPARLQDLAPEFIEAIPPDPFTGEPPLCRRAAGGFTVYSVGEDGRDDGGQTRWDDAIARRRDIGFRVHRPPPQF
jgi:hypothetical protein